jgi:hypothetical protein
MTKSVIDDRWIDLLPKRYNDGYFKFRNPITVLDSLTLSFGSPINPVVFDPDTGVATVAYQANTLFTTTTNHNLETGDRVTISGFNTLNPIYYNVLINSINSTSGHIVTYVSDTEFTIDIDTTPVAYSPPGTISVANNSAIVNGVGTNFANLNPGDNIVINGVIYIIDAIRNDVLSITTPYAGPTIPPPGIAFSINNVINGLLLSLYYESKRFFVQLEVEYLD